MTTPNHYAKIALCAVIVILAFLTGGVVARSSASAPARSLDGYAEWSCPKLAPESFVRSMLLLTDATAAYAAAMHEVDHERFMLSRASSCSEWTRVRQDKTVLLDMELRAYCMTASIMFAANRFESWDAAKLYYSRILASNYPYVRALGLGQSQVLMRMNAECEEPRG